MVIQLISHLDEAIKFFKGLTMLVILAIFLAGCATVYNPATGIEEVALVDTATEISVGRKMAWQVARQIPLSRDPVLNQRVNEIGSNITCASDRQDLDYHFYVIQDKQINAFTIPGGFIYVFSGLMETTDDDELAIVIAHEVGHVAARHPAKKMEVDMGYQLLDRLIFGRSTEGEMRQIMNIFFNIVAKGYERTDEFMADRLSLRYTGGAGYDPSAAIRFMKKLQAYESTRRSPAYTILSSHPPIEERIKNVEIEIARLKEEGYGKKGPVQKKVPASPIKPSKTMPSARPLEKKPSYRGVMVCPTCGREYPLNFNYCTRDGSKLE